MIKIDLCVCVVIPVILSLDYNLLQSSLNSILAAKIIIANKPNITTDQAKKLVCLGLSYTRLVKLHSMAKDENDFFQMLKSKDINSKPLQSKLAELLITSPEVS